MRLVCSRYYVRSSAEEDKEVSKKNGENRLLFDIIAGTSIGAMNGAILVSQFLQTGNWEKADGIT